MPNVKAQAVYNLAADKLAGHVKTVSTHERLISMGVPSRSALVLLSDDFDSSDPAVIAASRWSRRSGTFILAGPTGTSKTVAGALWLRESGSWGSWLHATKLESTGFSDWDSKLPSLVKPDRLVIDDFGAAGSTSPLALKRVGEILLERHDYVDKSTLILTNLSREAFSAAMDGVSDGRVIDRIRESGSVKTTMGASRRSRPADLDSARARLAEAHRFIHLCKRVDAMTYYGAAVDSADLARLQSDIGVTDEQVAAEVQRVAAARETIAGMIESLADVLTIKR